jgi:hypothetical protein
MVDKIDALTPDLFKDGPTDFITKNLAKQIIEEPHFNQIFGESVDIYDRQDYSMRQLPAIRFYGYTYTKNHESHYITGDIFCDVILPPLIRREQTEIIQNRIAAALMQQFRRPPFFAAMRKAVPGLNELGKVFTVDKTLGFQNDKMDDECPVTHITLNFRLDLKEWDAYLESQGRTKDDPFDVTLKNLKTIASEIAAIRVDADLETIEVKIPTTQKIGGP